MGGHEISAPDTARRRSFTEVLLRDVQALDELLQTDRFELGVRRIGAEQEMFLIDPRPRPANKATEILARAEDPRLTTPGWTSTERELMAVSSRLLEDHLRDGG